MHRPVIFCNGQKSGNRDIRAANDPSCCKSITDGIMETLDQLKEEVILMRDKVYKMEERMTNYQAKREESVSKLVAKCEEETRAFVNQEIQRMDRAQKRKYEEAMREIAKNSTSASI